MKMTPCSQWDYSDTVRSTLKAGGNDIVKSPMSITRDRHGNVVAIASYGMRSAKFWKRKGDLK